MTYEEQLEAQREERAKKARVVLAEPEEPKPAMTRAEISIACREQLRASRTTGSHTDHLIYGNAAAALSHRLVLLDAADAAAAEKGLDKPR